MYNTILVPIDISEEELTSKAVRHALYLAKETGLSCILSMSCRSHPRLLMRMRWVIWR